jgi:transcriptional regulator with XRE-family HTH domain
VPSPGNRMPRSTHHRHYRAFLDLLVQLRDEAGLTQMSLAERIGNTQTFVSKVERGERRLDAVEFAEWCEALGFDPGATFALFLGRREGKSRKLRRTRRR